MEKGSIGSLIFWFSFQAWAGAWEVLFRGYLQPCLLTLCLFLCFRQSLCVCGIWRKPFPYANRFFPSPPSPRQISQSVTTRSSQLQCSHFPFSTLEALLSQHTRCQSR